MKRFGRDLIRVQTRAPWKLENIAGRNESKPERAGRRRTAGQRLNAVRAARGAASAQAPRASRGNAQRPSRGSAPADPASAENFQAPRRDNDLPKIKNKIKSENQLPSFDSQHKGAVMKTSDAGTETRSDQGTRAEPGAPSALGRQVFGEGDGIKLGNEGSFHQTVPED